MLGNFIYSNPTKIYFGKDSLENLKTEIKKIWNKYIANLWRRIYKEDGSI